MRWPSKEDLDYVQKFLTVVLLLIGVPMAVYYALARPEHMASKMLGKAAG